MGWYISELENTIEVPATAQEELKALPGAGYIFEEDDCGAIDGKLVFCSDHMEHMDYIWQPGVIEVLLKHGASGHVTFGSLDGDNFGSFWGYLFTKDKCEWLKGALVWSVEKVKTTK